MLKRFLIIRWSGMGDVVMTLPALSLLKEHYPDCHITYLTDTPFTDILEASNHVDHVVGIDRRGFQRKDRILRTVVDTLKLISENRKAGFDLAFDLQGFGETALLAYFSGAKICVGKQKKDFIRKNIYKLKIDADWAIDHRSLYFNKAICQATGIPLPCELIAPSLPIPFKSLKNKKLIGLNIGASTPNRRWSESHFINLAEILTELGYKIQFFLGPQEEWLKSQINTVCMKNRWKLALHFNMNSLMQDLSQCSLLVSNDTGPGHLAAAFGIPVITLFSTGDPDNVKPLAPRASWFRDLGNINDINAEEVSKACLKILKY